MNPLSILRAATLLSALAFGGVCHYTIRHAIDHARELNYSQNLRQLRATDALLSEELLKSRSGLVMHYDGLVRGTTTLTRLLHSLADIPGFLGDAGTTELNQRLSELSRLLAEKSERLERFKTHNAVLRNSQRLMPVTLGALLQTGALDPELNRRVDATLAELLPESARNSQDTERELSAALALLDERLQRASSAPAREVALFRRHAGVVNTERPVVDEFVREFLALPFNARARELEDRYAHHYRAALTASLFAQRTLFGLALALVALGLTEVIVRIRLSGRALERATTELRTANQALAREREKERELGEMKTRFVAMTSHEFRTPLSVILSSTELLDQYGIRWDAERRAEHQSRIRVAAQSLIHLLDEILLIGRGESGMLKPSLGPLNLAELCRGVAETARLGYAGEQPIRLSLSGEVNVVSDERLLTRLLSNLIGNAMKYSAPGSGVNVEVTCAPEQLHIQVEDRGIGIDEAELPRLFDSFRRGTNVGQVKGSGLGLAVVRQAVDALGGSIQVHSRLGQGTTFSVRLPRVRERNPMAESA